MKLFIQLLTVLIFNISYIHLSKSENISSIVVLPNGELIGEYRNYFFAFEGIPYAEPPIGNKRFEPSTLFDQVWSGGYNATYMRSECVQFDYSIFDSNTDIVSGNEDCLFLNVYTRSLNPTKKYPVVIFIHGGAFTFGNGAQVGPEVLLQRDILLVTINYRLGPLGFISTLDSELPGNLGLKDQNIALQWVHNNIEKFGGDSNKITLAGFSAGGVSVHLHYMSPLSRGLFQNGISHSGSSLNPWAMTENPIDKARELAFAVGCPTNSTKSMKQCLKLKSVSDITHAVARFHVWLLNPFTVFGPVIEPAINGAFISKSPLQYIQNGEISPQPWIISFTDDEGIYPAGEFVQTPDQLPELDIHWNEYLPFILHFNDTVPRENLNTVSKNIRKFYIQDKLLNNKTFPSLINMLSDGLFKVGIQYNIKIQSQTTTTPIYFYHYKYPAKFGLDQHLSYSDQEWGVGHGDDVFTVHSNGLRKKKPYDEEEIKMQNDLLDLYESFVNDGVPRMQKVPLPLVSVNKDGIYNYITIHGPGNFTFDTAFDIANENFWDTVLPIS